MSAASEFIQQIERILARFFHQNGLSPLSADETAAFAARLWVLVTVRELPVPLGSAEMGVAGEMPPEELAPLVATLLDGFARAEALAVPARQLVKACFLPEFRTCRESYHEVSADGTCRRQQLSKVRGRVSGAHCVDCPYWTSLTLAQHERCLTAHWVGDPAEFAANRDVFLPEDFRALRLLLRRIGRELPRVDSPSSTAHSTPAI